MTDPEIIEILSSDSEEEAATATTPPPAARKSLQNHNPLLQKAAPPPRVKTEPTSSTAASLSTTPTRSETASPTPPNIQTKPNHNNNMASAAAPENIPSYKDMTKECWVCAVPLRVNFGVCFYTMHQHPLLQAPCCYTCANQIIQALDDADHNDHEDCCHACLDDEGDLVLCDGCPRQFCTRCLARCYGGGNDGWTYVQTKIILGVDGENWKGPCCHVPATLQKLVQDVEREQQLKMANRTVDDILAELQTVHEEHQATLHKLDNEDDMRAELKRELRENSSLDSTELAYEVEKELDAWREEHHTHLQRVEFRESSLQDELGRVGESAIDLGVVYAEMGMQRAVAPEDDEPDWVKEANRELAIRDMQQKSSKPTPFELPDSDEEDYNDVEDLFDDFADEIPLSEATDRRQGFRSDAVRQMSAESLARRAARAKAAEEAAHPEVLHAKRKTEKEDLQKTEKEEIEVANRGFRSDVIMPSKRRKRTQTSRPKKRSTSTVVVAANARPVPEPPLEQNVAKARTITPPDCPVRFDAAFLDESFKSDLKDHQIEGINLMFRNSFGEHPGGCILAHCMGLGKTATTLAFLCAAANRGLIDTVLIVVPTNTIHSWKREFEIWITSRIRGNTLTLDYLDEARADSRISKVKRFMEHGDGPRALLISHMTFPKVVDHVLDAGMVVIDEAHKPLSNSGTKTYKALSKLRTKLRIGLTGTPVSNNLVEYYNMMSFIRPGVLGDLGTFEIQFVGPINKGLTSDCTDSEKRESEKKSGELFRILKPVVNRKDATVLAKALPPLQQVALYVCPSKVQQSIYRRFKGLQKNEPEFKNFFRAMKAQAPINNHPATLLLDLDYSPSTSPLPEEGVSERDKGSSKTKKGKEDDSAIKKWWAELRERYGQEALGEIDAGYKFVLLLELLNHAERLGEKVLVFSGCLKTLDHLEEVLQSNSWRTGIPGSSASSPTVGWRKDAHYFRIDGSKQVAERSSSIDLFQQSPDARAFLLSVKAAGLGITLTAATRVVLLETDFNPSVSLQAIFRSYRYGQTKPVFVYRFLMRGTMEEKIYARCITKTGLACRVIDKKSLNRDFTGKEIEDLSKSLNWVQCDKCNKWRVLLEGGEEELPEEWFCSMNTDIRNNTCDAPERDAMWYENEIAGKHDGDDEDDALVVDSVKESESERFVQRDPILQSLLELKNSKGTAIITKYKFQQSLLTAKDLADSPESKVVVKTEGGATSSLKARNLFDSGSKSEASPATLNDLSSATGNQEMVAQERKANPGRRRVLPTKVSDLTNRKRKSGEAGEEKSPAPKKQSRSVSFKDPPGQSSNAANPGTLGSNSQQTQPKALLLAEKPGNQGNGSKEKPIALDDSDAESKSETAKTAKAEQIADQAPGNGAFLV